MKIIEKLKMMWHDSEGTNLHAIQGSSGRFELWLRDMLVGTLEYKDPTWSFYYSDEFKQQTEYAPLANFPSVGNMYTSEELWPFFKSRIPGANQLKASNDDKLDVLELLRKYATHVISNPYILSAQ